MVADWLNKAFEGFDYALLKFGNDLHNSAGGFFDGFMKFITAFGDGGIILILIAICLIAFKKTRKIGLTMFVAIAIGALITNITIKPLVARPRPFVQDSTFNSWWVAVGSVQESEFSFPSGHATASMAAMMAFFLAGNKKYSWTGFLFSLLVGFSRIYLCVHYPSDVLFGFIVGIVAGSLAYLIIWLLYKYLKGTKVGEFLYEKDIITLYKYIKCKCDKKKGVVANADGNNLSATIVEDNSSSKQVVVAEEKNHLEVEKQNQNSNNEIPKINDDNTVVDTQNINDNKN